MTRGLELDCPRQRTAPDPREQFLASLDGTFRPAMLLRFESVHVHRQFGGCHHIVYEDKFPARELGSVAQVEVLGQRVVLPAAGFFDARFAPETSRAVE